MKIEGLPVIEVDESEEITVAVRADDLLEGDTADPKQHPIAVALRRQDDVDDARVTKNETLIRRCGTIIVRRYIFISPPSQVRTGKGVNS